MQKLIEGIHQFRTQHFPHHRALFERLKKGQSPEALFLTCSDSRVNPNLITQTDPGDLFIVRNAGNLIPPQGTPSGEEAAIEYAITALGVQDLIVCGHSQCGAVKALIDDQNLDAMPAVRRWLGHAEATARIISENYGHLEPAAKWTAAVEENVLVQMEHLHTLPAAASALARGELRVHGWVYKIETGEVFAYNPTVGQFERVDATSATPAVPGMRRLRSV